METPVEISVILSAHNSESTLRLAIKSTLLALPKSSELLVCLHKCSDNSKQIANSVQDERLRVLTLDEGSLAHALNYLIDESAGEFIARMDADDICLPWRFKLQLREMRLHPEIDLLFSPAIIFGEAIKPLWVFPQYLTRLDDERFKFLLTISNPGVHPTLIARRRTLESNLYRNVPAEDLDLWLRIATSGAKFQRTRLPVLLYKSHFTQMSRRKEILSGWQNSDDISHARKVLAKSRLSRLYLQSRRRFAVTHPLLALEIVGFPSLAKLRHWLSAKSGGDRP